MEKKIYTYGVSSKMVIFAKKTIIFSSITKVLVVLMLGVLVSCKSTEFAASSARKPNVANTEVISLACLNESAAFSQKTLRGNPKTKLKVTGRVCPNQDDIFEKKTVLILLDQSESMRVNDKVEAGSCARLDAIKALVNKIEKTENATDNVSVGIIGFETNAQALATPSKISEIQRILAVDPLSICDYRGFTNYEAVIDTATTLLKNIDGSKDVYLISDGLPTRSSKDIGLSGRQGTPSEAGLAASESLRSIDELSFFVLYLQSKLVGIGGEDPRAYLTQIAGGDNSRVKIVESAERLADEILKFDIKEAPMISVLNPLITLSAANGPQREVKVVEIVESLTERGVWEYESEEFLPFSADNSEVVNRIDVKMTSNNGTVYSARVEVSFAFENFGR